MARSKLSLDQSQANLKALELTIATEVTNAALTVQSSLESVQASAVARELSQKRLEAAQSKFEVGMATNYEVVQAQRDFVDARNNELRSNLNYRKALVNFEVSQTVGTRAVAAGVAGANTTGGINNVATTTGAGGTGGTGGQDRRWRWWRRHAVASRRFQKSDMRKFIFLPIVAVLALAGFLVYNRGGNEESSAQAAGSGQSQPGGRGGRGAARPPMPVEFAVVKRAPLTERILIVGNLIGAATVQVVPKVTAGWTPSASSLATR